MSDIESNVNPIETKQDSISPDSPQQQSMDEKLQAIISDIESEIHVITKDWTITRKFDGRLGTPQKKLSRSVARMLKYYVPKLLDEAVLAGKLNEQQGQSDRTKKLIEATYPDGLNTDMTGHGAWDIASAVANDRIAELKALQEGKSIDNLKDS